MKYLAVPTPQAYKPSITPFVGPLLDPNAPRLRENTEAIYRMNVSRAL